MIGSIVPSFPTDTIKFQIKFKKFSTRASKNLIKIVDAIGRPSREKEANFNAIFFSGLDCSI